MLPLRQMAAASAVPPRQNRAQRQQPGEDARGAHAAPGPQGTPAMCAHERQELVAEGARPAPPPLPRACIATYWARPNARTEGRAHTGSAAREPNAASSCTHAHESTRCSPATAPARPPRHIVALVTYARSTTL